MTVFSGVGLFRPYSCEIVLESPIAARDLGELLKLPENYYNYLIAVRGSRVLNKDDLIYDGDEILLYMALMGG